MWAYLLPTLLLFQSIAVQAQVPFVPIAPFPGPVIDPQTSIVLLGYGNDGCTSNPGFGPIRNNIGCIPITSPGITKVVVLAHDNMPSTCILTLYADSNCLVTSSADIGPISPTWRPSSCIGPIRNSAGDLFEAKGVTLKC
ncbi:hypothetical protein B9Z19DRAFT_1087571 [Tuber borchii]|uniref:Uncharacterized protein n=1 Tax=Tuber borchii TaxID=42251 RepID=A0A2T6ZMT3_TUBBO|nr:hypothetical protein B9Z19DRAFT_1087571 [Tuber borchii]